jgi:hypothetical protein
MRLVFLDVDGVLNSILFWLKQRSKGISSINCMCEPIKNLDPHCVDLLHIFINNTNSKIVLTSTWRKDPKFFFNNETEEEKIKIIKSWFKKFGWKDFPLIGLTPNLSGFRGEEVATYLDNSKEEIDDYIILDDSDDFIQSFNTIPIHTLDKIGLIDEKERNMKSQYWQNQKLYLVNKETGLTYNDLIQLLKLWEPNNRILIDHKDSAKEQKRLGKYW